MNLSELAAYAERQYQIREEYKWVDFPGFSVLRNPRTGKWVAMLMRQWDAETGTEIQCCDIKCGQYNMYKYKLSYFSAPFRMHGQSWLGVRFVSKTEPQLIYRLFDLAIRTDNKRAFKNKDRGFTFSLSSPQAAAGFSYRETAIPQPDAGSMSSDIPEKIREMMRLYQFGDGSFLQKCKNFCMQGMFMKDYEDDFSWNGDFKRFFPTYHDLRVEQLRGYFSWRTNVRKGNYGPTAISFAYIYIYELLNQIGTESPEDSLNRMKAFETGFLDAGFGDAAMRKLLHRWMMEFAVIHGVSRETAVACADPEMITMDGALVVLKTPAEHSDEAVFDAMCSLCSTKVASSPAITRNPAEGKHLFAEIWKYTLDHYQQNDRDIFSACFGEFCAVKWHPLGNAVYWEKHQFQPVRYILNPCHIYEYKNDSWQERCYQTFHFDRKRLEALLHEADRKLRLYLKTGHPLKQKPDESWAEPYIDAVIEADRQQKAESARPKVNIDFSGLDKIRDDAVFTRDSLLTEDETDGDLHEPVLDSADTEEKNVSLMNRNIVVDIYNDNPERAIGVQPGGLRWSRAPLLKLSPSPFMERGERSANRLTEGGEVCVTPGQAIPQMSTQKECRDYSHINDSPERAIRVQLTEEGEVCVTPGQAIPQISTLKVCRDYSPIIPAQNNSDADNTDSNVLPDLDETHLCILKMLLDGQSVKSFLATRRLMPSIVADTINEALWDLIGDNVLECDGDNISVIEDYRDDVKSIFQ